MDGLASYFCIINLLCSLSSCYPSACAIVGPDVVQWGGFFVWVCHHILRPVPVLRLSITNSSFRCLSFVSFSMISRCSSRGSVVSTLLRFVVFLAMSEFIILR